MGILTPTKVKIARMQDSRTLRIDPSEALVVGYGTLLYRASLGQTLGRDAAEKQEMFPVLIRGFRRLFNLRPDHYEASELWGRPGVENAAMNVERAEGESLNGLAFKVGREELAKLDARERYYDRLEVEAADFATGHALGVAQIYSSRLDARWLERDPAMLLPRWRDLVWARTGAYAIGQAFGETFDRTTYLADGLTLAVERYREPLSRPELAAAALVPLGNL